MPVGTLTIAMKRIYVTVLSNSLVPGEETEKESGLFATLYQGPSVACPVVLCPVRYLIPWSDVTFTNNT
jgi:hypothetical protein